MRARMAIAVSGIDVELREVVLRDKPPEMLAASPKGTVPVLVLSDEAMIDESLDIMRWALGENDPDNWLSGYDPVLIAANDGPFKTALDQYKYPHRYDLADGNEYGKIGLDWLAELSNMLMAQPFLSGPKLGMTDIAIFPFVRQFAATDHVWFASQSLLPLQIWLEEQQNSLIFEKVMQKYPAWKQDDAITIFP